MKNNGPQDMQLLSLCTCAEGFQGCVQDLRKGGAEPNVREACAKVFSHAPKTLTMPLINTFLMTKKAVLGLVATRLLFRASPISLLLVLAQ